MDEVTAIEFRKRAIHSAKVRGFRQDSEDLAHDVLVRWLDGKGQHQLMDHAVIDSIREAFGRTPIELAPVTELERKPSGETHPDRLLDFDRMLEPLYGIDRAMVCLAFKWGLSVAEIAHCFFVSPQDVEYTLEVALKKIKRRRL